MIKLQEVNQIFKKSFENFEQLSVHDPIVLLKDAVYESMEKTSRGFNDKLSFFFDQLPSHLGLYPRLSDASQYVFSVNNLTGKELIISDSNVLELGEHNGGDLRLELLEGTILPEDSISIKQSSDYNELKINSMQPLKELNLFFNPKKTSIDHEVVGIRIDDKFYDLTKLKVRDETSSFTKPGYFGLQLPVSLKAISDVSLCFKKGSELSIDSFYVNTLKGKVYLEYIDYHLGMVEVGDCQRVILPKETIDFPEVIRLEIPNGEFLTLNNGHKDKQYFARGNGNQIVFYDTSSLFKNYNGPISVYVPRLKKSTNLNLFERDLRFKTTPLLKKINLKAPLHLINQSRLADDQQVGQLNFFKNLANLRQGLHRLDQEINTLIMDRVASVLVIDSEIKHHELTVYYMDSNTNDHERRGSIELGIYQVCRETLGPNYKISIKRFDVEKINVCVKTIHPLNQDQKSMISGLITRMLALFPQGDFKETLLTSQVLDYVRNSYEITDIKIYNRTNNRYVDQVQFRPHTYYSSSIEFESSENKSDEL